MENVQSIAQTLSTGIPVNLQTEEGEFKGIFKQVDDGSEGKEIQLTKCYHMGKELPGIQPFSLASIETIVSLKRELSKNELNINGLKISDDTSPLLDNITNIVPDSNIPPRPKSKSKVKDRPVICKVRKKNIADISHLNNLHLLRMPELMEQVQMEDSPPLQASKDIPGAFYIPQPEQDPEHMEGDKYKNRHSLEFTAVRSQTWKDMNTIPEIHCPEIVFIIRDLQEAMFSKALEHLNKTRTIGVSLEGQFLGRLGKLSLISFATPERVYMFDVVFLGDHCFDMGLRQILEDSDIQKGNFKDYVTKPKDWIM